MVFTESFTPNILLHEGKTQNLEESLLRQQNKLLLTSSVLITVMSHQLRVRVNGSVVARKEYSQKET